MDVRASWAAIRRALRSSRGSTIALTAVVAATALTLVPALVSTYLASRPPEPVAAAAPAVMPPGPPPLEPRSATPSKSESEPAPKEAAPQPAAAQPAPAAAPAVAAATVAPRPVDQPRAANRRSPAPSAGSAVRTRGNPHGRPSTGGVRLGPTGQGRLSGRVIVVDPGHNGRSDPAINNRLVPNGAGGRKPCNTTGTASTSGYSEHAHNWAVATRLAVLLRAQGATVVLTRPDDRGIGPCVDERAAIGNRARADLVLSIHADGAGASQRGFHIIRSTRMAGGRAAVSDSARAATIVRDVFAAVTKMPRSTYLGKGTAMTPRGDIAGLNLSKSPGIMLEAGNMRNPRDARLLRDSTFQAKEAAALATAAMRLLAG